MALAVLAGLVGVLCMAWGAIAGLLLGIVLTAISGGGVQSMATTLTGDVVSHAQRGRAIGLLHTAGDLGSALGPPVAYFLIPFVALRGAYLLCAGLLAFGLVLSLWLHLKQPAPALVADSSDITFTTTLLYKEAPVQYRELGRSGLTVSTISMGCWPIVGDAVWGPQDKSESIASLHAAVDCGINFFDSAEAYGNGFSEELLRDGLSDRRDKVIIASKALGAHLSAKDLPEACEASLKRLGTDYIDVYYLHWPNHEIPYAETMAAMQKLKQQGKIRVIACSNFGLLDLPELLQYGRPEVNELPYSLLFRAIEFDILPICERETISATAYMPLMQGLLAGKYHTADDVPEMRARTRHFSPKRKLIRHHEQGAEEETFTAINKIRAICSAAGLDMAQVALAWPLRLPIMTSVIVGARTRSRCRPTPPRPS